MALHYESDKIIQLVQLCSWRERTEMSQGGLMKLAEKVASNEEFNDRYIVDLMSDARKGLKEGTTIKKNESPINLLLNHVGFNHWDDWKAALRTPAEFLSPENADFNNPEGKPFTIIVPQVLDRQLISTLNFVKKTAQIDVRITSETTLTDSTKHTIALLESSPLVICALPLSWNDQAIDIRQPAWGEFSGTKRILPVWVDENEAWNPVSPFLSSVKQKQATAGLPGILTGLLFLENYVQQETANAEKATQQKTSGNGPQFHNSPVGFYMHGGTIHHLATGGDQIINNNFD